MTMTQTTNWDEETFYVKMQQFDNFASGYFPQHHPPLNNSSFLRIHSSGKVSVNLTFCFFSPVFGLCMADHYYSHNKGML